MKIHDGITSDEITHDFMRLGIGKYLDGNTFVISDLTTFDSGKVLLVPEQYIWVGLRLSRRLVRPDYTLMGLAETTQTVLLDMASTALMNGEELVQGYDGCSGMDKSTYELEYVGLL